MRRPSGEATDCIAHSRECLWDLMTAGSLLGDCNGKLEKRCSRVGAGTVPSDSFLYSLPLSPPLPLSSCLPVFRPYSFFLSNPIYLSLSLFPPLPFSWPKGHCTGHAVVFINNSFCRSQQLLLPLPHQQYILPLRTYTFPLPPTLLGPFSKMSAGPVESMFSGGPGMQNPAVAITSGRDGNQDTIWVPRIGSRANGYLVSPRLGQVCANPGNMPLQFPLPALATGPLGVLRL